MSKTHIVRCYRASGDSYQFVCSCGWAMNSEDRDEVASAAAVHDKQPVKGPPLRCEGFVTGLADDDR